MNNIYNKLFYSLFGFPKAVCSNSLVDLDDPNFANLDPHLKFDDVEKQENYGLSRPISRVPPGFDNFMNAIRAITKKVEHIKGFRFELGLPCSQNFHTVHTWNIPNYVASARSPQGSYTLSAQYVMANFPTSMEAMPATLPEPSLIMTGRMESNGRLESAIIKPINDKVQLRLTSQYQNSDPMTAQMHLDLDYQGDDCIHTFKYGTGLWAFNFMQTIGRGLVLGFELMNLIDRKQSLLSGAMRYNYKNHNIYANYTAIADSLTIAYMLRVNKNAQLVSELSINTADGETKTIVGYRQRFANTEVIATLNSKGKISSIINILGGGIYQLKLCAVADYQKDTYKFGYGLTFGQSG